MEKAGPWNEDTSLINDFDFSPRVLLNTTKVKYAKGARLLYRSGLATNLSGQRSRKHLESAFLALSNTTKLLLDKDNSEEAKKVLARTWRSWSYNFYPFAMDLYQEAEKMIQMLGGHPHIQRKGKSHWFGGDHRL